MLLQKKIKRQKQILKPVTCLKIMTGRNERACIQEKETREKRRVQLACLFLINMKLTMSMTSLMYMIRANWRQLCESLSILTTIYAIILVKKCRKGWWQWEVWVYTLIINLEADAELLCAYLAHQRNVHASTGDTLIRVLVRLYWASTWHQNISTNKICKGLVE